MDTNKLHHSALAKFRQAISEKSSNHLQHLQQTPQVPSNLVDDIIQKQKEAFQSLSPTSTSKLQPAESAIIENDPFHSDNLRVPYSVAFQTTMASSPRLPPTEEDNTTATAKTDMSIVNSLVPPKAGAGIPTPTSTSPEIPTKNELRNLHLKMERMIVLIENMQATTMQLFYDFMVYLILGILIVFTLDQYVAHRNITLSSVQRMTAGNSGIVYHR